MTTTPDPLGLASEIARLWQEIHQLRGALRLVRESSATAGQVEQLGADVAALARSVVEVAAGLQDDEQQAALRPIWWPHLHEDEPRADAWRRLTHWVDGVLGDRVPDRASRALAPCWVGHPNVVDELSALMVAWHAAYAVPAPLPTAAIEWQDRWLPGSLKRITESLRGCGSMRSPTRPLVEPARPG